MTTYTVRSGVTSSGLSLVAGDVATVAAGGTIVSSTVGQGATLNVQSGGAASSTAGYGRHGVSVQSGGVLNNSGKTLYTDLLGGTEYIGAGGNDTYTFVGSGSVEYLAGAGAVASGSDLNAGGQQVVTNGTAFDTVVIGGAVQTISGHGVSYRALVYSGGRQVISNASADSIAYATVVSSGGSESVAGGGTTSGSVISSGGSESVGSGGLAIGTTVGSGGQVIVSAGGTLSATMVSAGGVEVVLAGGAATGTVLNPGGSIDLPFLPFTDTSAESISVQGNVITVVDRGQSYAQRLGNSPAGFLLSTDGGGGTLVTAVTQAISSGVTKSDLNLANGDLAIAINGGKAIRTTIGAGAVLDVQSGGTSLSATVNSGGSARIEVQGAGSNTVINAGGYESVAGVESGSTIGSSGTQAVGGTGAAYYTTINQGGTQIVGLDNRTLQGVAGGISDFVTLNGVEQVLTSGFTSGVTINSGGLLQLGYGATAYGGTAANVVINAGGSASLNYLGVLNGVIVRSGGVLTDGEGRVTGAVLSGGAETVGGDVGAVDIGTTVLAGSVQHVWLSGIASSTVVSAGGKQYVNRDGSAYGAIINSGGLQTVDSGGHTYGTIVNSGGTQIVSNTYPGQSNPTAFGTIVHSGGTQIVSSGGGANDTILQFGGTEIVGAGGITSLTVVGAGGTEIIAAGGVASDSIIKLGGSIDLVAMPYTATGSASVVAQNDKFLLTVTEGSQTYTQRLSNAPPGSLTLSNDGQGGTLVTATGSVPAGVTFNPGAYQVSSASVLAAMYQAIADWGKYLISDRQLQVEIDIGPTPYPSEVAVDTSTLRPIVAGQTLGTKTQAIITTPQDQLTIANQGLYPGPDIVVTLNPQYLSSIYFGSNLAGAPAGQIDGVSLFEHELGHALGIIGQRDQSGQLFGSESIYDTFVQIDPTTGLATFVGHNAVGQNGGSPVPLTTGTSGGANFYAVGNGSADPLSKDLMGRSLAAQTAYGISGVDLAILMDVGLPADIDHHTSGQANKTIVPVTFAAGTAQLTQTPGTTQFTWLCPGIVNPSLDAAAYNVQRQVWLTNAPYQANSQGFEILNSGYLETVPLHSTSAGLSVVSPTTPLPVSNQYYVTFVLAEEDSSGKYVQMDKISYGQIYINNPNPTAALVNYAPTPPDEGDGGGGGQDAGGGSTDSGGGGNNGGGSDSSSGNETPNVPNTTTTAQPAITADAWDPVTAHGTPVYRLFDTIHGTQFLTSSLDERNSILATRTDLSDEGVGLDSIPAFAVDAKATPVFRFFDTIYGTHFYSASASERDTVVETRPDLTYEGPAFNEYVAQQAGTAPVYRFFESTNGTHFFTASESERAVILSTRPDLLAEGVAFYSPIS